MAEAVRVLLVEDDEDDYLLARRYLSEPGPQSFQLQWARTLREARERLGAGGFELVLLDLSLPDSHGQPTFLDLRTSAPDLPVIILTGLADDTQALRALQEGAQDYLPKGRMDGGQVVRAARYAIERKKAEVALKRYQEQLEEMVQERTADLSRAVTELREAVARLEEHDRAKSQFVSNVSHELKTPLTSMTFAIENILRGAAGPIQERVVSYLTIMKKECGRLTHTVSDILDLGRIEADALVLNRVRLPMSRFVRRSAEALRADAEAKHIALSVTAPDGTGFVDLDPHKMDRALRNVLHNAVKYTPSEGRVTVYLHPDTLRPGHLVIEVTDTGIGIEAQHLPHVTERYYRVAEHVDGTGLGLSIAKEIVERHNGHLVVASPPPGAGSGTRVSVALPVSEPPRVLVCDDNPDVRMLLGLQLQSCGYHTWEAINGRVGLEGLVQQRTDAAILDLNMPVMDGIETIRAMKADAQLRRIPVVVVTGGELGGSRFDVLQSYGIPALAKPWKEDELLDTVEAVMTGGQYLRR
jgi:signal transduction histidine kinase